MKPGTVLGNYELMEQVGAGSMGDVFRARQISMNRIVALKILPERFAESESFVRRFVREARSAGRCNHANLIQVYDVGTSDGRHYFSMEFVGGPTLMEVLAREGPLQEAEAVGQMLKVAAALGEAHSHGIVHRDVKPENVILTEQSEPKLADLGLAKPLRGEADESNVGKPLGTPYYMSPEQARGEKVDGRADLYALGATFFHLLAGETLFSGPTPAVVMAKHTSEAPRPLRRLRPDASRGIELALLKLLQKKPEDRYPDAPTLIEDLHDLSVGRRPKHAWPPPDAGRRRAGPGRRPSAVGIASVAQAGRPRTGLWVAAGALPVAILAVAVILISNSGEGENGAKTPSPPPPKVVKVPTTSRPTPDENQSERLAGLLSDAETFTRQHPDDYERAIQLFSEVAAAGRGGPYESKANEKLGALRSAWRRAAMAALRDAAKEARAKTDSGDYDGALARLQAIPPGLAPQVAGEIEEEARRVRRTGTAKIDKIIAAAKAQLDAGSPGTARKVLAAVSGVRSADGRADAAERVARLASRIDAIEEEQLGSAERAARERLADLLPEFEACVKAGMYVEARELAQASAAEEKGSVALALRAVVRVARALESRREVARRELEALARRGDDIVLETTKGPRKGRIERTSEDGIELAATITSGRQVVGRTRLVVYWADLLPEQEDRLAKAWKPQGPDGQMARAIIAICREDADAAERALDAAGEHPMAEYLREALKSLDTGPADDIDATGAPPEEDGPIVTSGLALWYGADTGLQLDGKDGLKAWSDRSGNGRHARQADTSLRPLRADLNGRPVVRFDGVDDFLEFTCDVNGLTGMTIIVVSACREDAGTGKHNNGHAAVWWGETGPWGNVVLVPAQKAVALRFGTGQRGNMPTYARPRRLGAGDLTISAAVHDGRARTDRLYVDGVGVLSKAGRLSSLTNNKRSGRLGRGEYDSYFPGDLAEVLVYSTALPDGERRRVERYLAHKYLGRALAE